MPEMDGIELARRADRARPGAQGHVHHRLRRGGAQRRNSAAPKDARKVLSKPFHLRDLVNEVQKMLTAA